MKSAFAEAIEAFLAGGGKITHCPEGNGLLPKEKVKYKTVGRSAQDRQHFKRNAAAVIAALAAAPQGLTLLGLEGVTGLPYRRLRRLVAALEAENKIVCSVPARERAHGSNRVLFYRLATANSNNKSEAA